jgi:formylmethanofuran dehydrogenase subunit D
MPVPKSQGQTESKSKLPASVQAMLKASIPEAPTAIYGSVSTQDVAQYIRETVAYNDEAAQIQINESNLKFVDIEDGDDATRIKHLGQFEVEISFKGTDTTTRKRVMVKKPREEVVEVMIDPSIGQMSSSPEVVDHR